MNVGCIPKKLMHTSGLFGEFRGDMRESGWDLGDKDKEDRGKAFNWTNMVENVNRHVKGLNTDLKGLMLNGGVMFYNGLVTLKDAHTLELKLKNGKVMTKKAK